jgi:hypothetical protein
LTAKAVNDISFLKNELAPKTYLIETKIQEQKEKANEFLKIHVQTHT